MVDDEQRGAAAPVVIAPIIVDGVAALRMNEGAGLEIRLQPGPPVILHMVLQSVSELRGWFRVGGEHHECLDDGTAQFVRFANYGGLQYGRMF